MFVLDDIIYPPETPDAGRRERRAAYPPPRRRWAGVQRASSCSGTSESLGVRCGNSLPCRCALSDPSRATHPASLARIEDDRWTGLYAAQSWLNWTVRARNWSTIQVLAIFVIPFIYIFFLKESPLRRLTRSLDDAFPKKHSSTHTKKKKVYPHCDHRVSSSPTLHAREVRVAHFLFFVGVARGGVAAPQLSSQSWARRASDCMAHLWWRRTVIGPCESWLCPRGAVGMFPVGEQLGCFSHEAIVFRGGDFIFLAYSYIIITLWAK